MFFIEFAVAYLFCGVVCSAFMISSIRKQSYDHPEALRQIDALVRQGAFGDEESCRRMLVRTMLIYMALIWPHTIWKSIRDRKKG